MKVYPTKKKATKPKPKIAKFVLTTWAACFARQKPGLDEREARLHEDDEHRADHDPEQVDVDRGYRLWHRVLGERRGRSEQHCCSHHPHGR